MMHHRLVEYTYTAFLIPAAHFIVGRLIVAGPIVESALLPAAACLFALFLVKLTPPVKNVLRKRGVERWRLHFK